MGTVVRVMKGDTKSSDDGSYRFPCIGQCAPVTALNWVDPKRSLLDMASTLNHGISTYGLQ